MNSKIRVGAVSYYNTLPLLYGIEHTSFRDDIELVKAFPSRLADMLLTEEIDVGLIPVVAVSRFPEFYLASDFGIATTGEVASVCLFSESPLSDIQTIILDYQSRSSVALLKILAREYWNIRPQYVLAEDESYLDKIKGNTAALVIGDRALQLRSKYSYIYDLGLEWKKMTGLPFVFAAWVSTRPMTEEFIQAFNAANAVGLDRLKEIADSVSFPHYDLFHYYTQNIHYRLNEQNKGGMRLFLDYIRKSERVS